MARRKKNQTEKGTKIVEDKKFQPYVPADKVMPEFTAVSILLGALLAIIFGGANAYLGLRVGMTVSASIPAAVISMGVIRKVLRRDSILENNMVQTIGSAGESVAAGAIFTLPALYILGLDAAFYQVFLSSLFGGLLGIVLLIPFRKYFVKEMHGKYPFPEATATTEVLVSGEKGGNQAKLLAVAGLIGGLYDFAVGTFGMWTEAVSTRICAWGQVAADKFKVVFSLNTSAAVLGLGYIIGLKYAMIITAGSCLVWFLVVPLVGSLADSIDPAAMASLLGVTRADIMADPQRLFTAENLFAFIGKPLGIGGIAFALAAQDTVKNIFGAFTIFTDKPFGIGDTINVNGFEGTVVDVGMRSTRIMGYDRRITSYPNYKITDASIVNISSEPMRRAMVKLGLTYDTGAEKMKQALEILRAIPAKIKDVSGNPSDVTAYFSDYTDSALVVTFYYYIEKQGDVLKTTSDVNLEILDSFAKAGLTFAFPTRTLLVHQDDAEKAGGEPAAADGTQIQNS